MIKIYADSEEKYLKGVIAYVLEADGASPFLAWDSEGTKRVYADEAIELFRKGLLLIHAGNAVDFSEHLPVSLETMKNGVVIHLAGEAFFEVPFSSNENNNEDAGEVINPTSGV